MVTVEEDWGSFFLFFCVRLILVHGSQVILIRGKGGEAVEVTEVRIRKVNREGKMKAIVSVTLDDQFVVHDIRVIQGNNGLFIAMPSKRTPAGEFKDIAHPITSQARELIQSAVLEVYGRELLKQGLPEERVEA